MDTALLDRALDFAKWALPFVCGYLAYVHRSLLKHDARIDALADRVTDHATWIDKLDAVLESIRRDVSDIRATLARLDERTQRHD